jgi:Mg2+ and Co2+ transporter CorA
MPESQEATPSVPGTDPAQRRIPAGDTEPAVAALVDATGILLPAGAGDVQQRMTAGRFFWLDVFTTDATARGAMVAQLGLADADRGWILRFGQAPRMSILPSGARVVTMAIGAEDQSIEMHVLWTEAWVVTVWAGNVASLREIRERFVTRLRGTHETAFICGTALLLLLLSTVDDSLTRARTQLYALEDSLDGLTTADLNNLRSLRRRILKASVHADHYCTSVRSAVVGIDILPGVDAEGALLAREYADHVEDLAHRQGALAEMARTVASDIPAVIARKQSQRINQLTVISAIFLPITFLTGFFGMNFQWMISGLVSREAFFVLAVALPIAMMAVTAMLLAREGFIRRRPDGYH